MKIANIIYEDELINHQKNEVINYYKEPLKYDDLDKSLPTLYVGWSFMKKCNENSDFIQNADILRKKIIKNQLYWEFSFKESKPSHVKGVNNFTNIAPEFFFTSKYTYINLDPVFFQICDVDELLDVLPKQINCTYRFKNKMIYVLYENKITGIDLEMYNFFKFPIDELIERIQSRCDNNNDDLNGEIYIDYNKKFHTFKNIRRYIVTILSK